MPNSFPRGPHVDLLAFAARKSLCDQDAHTCKAPHPVCTVQVWNQCQPLTLFCLMLLPFSSRFQHLSGAMSHPLRVCQAQQDSRRRLPALWAVEGCAVEVLLHHLLPSLLLLLTVASGCTWRECWQFCRSWSCSFSCCWSIFRRNADFLRCLGCRDRCMCVFVSVSLFMCVDVYLMWIGTRTLCLSCLVCDRL